MAEPKPTACIKTDSAPRAIGPYSQGIVLSSGRELVFTSGQIALDPGSGQLISGNVADETRRVLRNLEAILVEAGSSLRQVVRCTVFLQDLNDFATMNQVYAEFFADPPPSRSTVQVAGLPKGARVEIDAIAWK